MGTTTERINDAFLDVDFANYDEVKAASKKLTNIPGKEVIAWLSKEAKQWNYTVIFYGIKNIEKIFGAEFDLEWIINLFFSEPDIWSWRKNDEILKEFKDVTGKDITVDDVTNHIDIDFLLESVSFDVGITGFLEFIKDNGGDPRLLVKKVASVEDELTYEEVTDIVYSLDPYIEPDDFNFEKLFLLVDWSDTEEFGITHGFLDFFRKFAPGLVPP